RDERLRRETRLRDAKEKRLRHGRRLLLLLRPIVDLAEDLLVNVLALEELRLAGIQNTNLLEHLPDDDADVFIVDLHALESVDLLDFIQQVLLHGARAFNS